MLRLWVAAWIALVLPCSGAATPGNGWGGSIILCGWTSLHGPGAVSSGPLNLVLRGGGNALGANGDAITEEQAGEELIKAANANNIAVSLPRSVSFPLQKNLPPPHLQMDRKALLPTK